MTKEDLRNAVNRCVAAYIEDYDVLGADSQLRINPATFDAVIMSERDKLDEIADADEALESAAAAQGMESQESMDYQVKQNPEFYPMSIFVRIMPDGHMRPDEERIEEILSKY